MASHGGKRKGAGRKPGAKAKATKEQKQSFAELAREHAPRALEILIDIAENGQSESARMAGCKELLDRAYGRAPQSVDVKGDVIIEIVSTVPRANGNEGK